MKTSTRAEQQLAQLVAAGDYGVAVNILHTLDRLDRMGFDSDDIVALVNGSYDVYVVDARGAFIAAIGERGGATSDCTFATLLDRLPTDDRQKQDVGRMTADLAGIIPFQCVSVP